MGAGAGGCRPEDDRMEPALRLDILLMSDGVMVHGIYEFAGRERAEDNGGQQELNRKVSRLSPQEKPDSSKSRHRTAISALFAASATRFTFLRKAVVPFDVCLVLALAGMDFPWAIWLL